MAWSVLQSASAAPANGTGTTTAAASFTSNLTSGTKIIAFMGMNPQPVISSVKDTAGNSLTLLGSLVSQSIKLAAYAMDTPAGDVGGTTTITVTLGTAAPVAMVIQEVSGLLVDNTTAMLDAAMATAGFPSGTASEALPAYTTTASGEYLATFLIGEGGGTATVPSGYTVDAHAVNGNTFVNCVVGYKNSTGGSETGTWTGTSANNNLIAVLAFKLPAGPAPPIPQQPGGAVWRRIHRRKQTAPLAVALAVAGPAGNQPGGLIARRSASQYSRAVTGSSVTADGSAGPPPPPPVAAAAPQQLLPVAARRYPPRAVFRGLAAPPLQPLLPRPPPPPVAARPLAQRPRALVAFRPVATTNAVPPRGAQPGGLVRRRTPARAFVAFRPVVTVNAAGPAGSVQPRPTVGLPRRYPSRAVWDSAAGPANAHGPAGAKPGTGLVRARPAGQIHRVVWAGTTVRTTNNVAVPRGTVPPRPVVGRRATARALVAFTPVRTVNSTRPTVTGGLVRRRSAARAVVGFTPVATVNASGPAGAAQPRAAVPVPRRVAARALWQRAIGPANAHGGNGAQPGTGLVKRRIAARGFVAFRPVRTVNNTLIPAGTVPPKPVVVRRTAARAVVAFRPVRTVNAPPTVSAPVTGGLIARRHPKQVSRSRLGVGIGGSGIGAAPRAAQPVTGGVTARRHPKQVSRARTGLGIGGAGVDAAARLAQPATGTGLVRRRTPARAYVAFRPVRTVNAVPPRGSVQPKPVIARRYPARAYVAFRPVRTTAPLFSVGTLTAATAATATQTPAAAPANVLTAATGPSSAITATTQKAGGPS